jgi:TPR repeat protein
VFRTVFAATGGLVFALCLTSMAVAGIAEDAFARGDYATAVKEWRRSAELGNAFAQIDLAQLYYEGRGVPQDKTLAAQWFRKAADQGFAQAQYNLATMLMSGDGIAIDPAEAARLFRLAAEKSYLPAEVSLGGLYRDGKGVAQDAAAAARWYRDASDKGDVIAHFQLGNMYRLGMGVGQDPNKAITCYRLAANAGYSPAQFDLGYAYYTGYGTTPSAYLAYYWIALAAKNYDQAATDERARAEAARNTLSSKLSPEELAKAQEAVGSWRATTAITLARTTAELRAPAANAPNQPKWKTMLEGRHLSTGSVELNCSLDIGGKLHACVPKSESPEGSGLARDATDLMAPQLNFIPITADCAAVESSVQISLVYRL